MLLINLTILTLLEFADDDAVAGIIGILAILFLIVICLAFYFLPTLIAASRNHHQWGTIFVVNIFFGWTFVGWVVALAWSVSASRNRSS